MGTMLDWQFQTKNNCLVVAFSLLFPSLRHCTVWHCTVWHCTVWHCTAWHCTVWHCTVWHALCETEHLMLLGPFLQTSQTLIKLNSLDACTCKLWNTCLLSEISSTFTAQILHDCLVFTPTHFFHQGHWCTVGRQKTSAQTVQTCKVLCGQTKNIRSQTVQTCKVFCGQTKNIRSQTVHCTDM